MSTATVESVEVGGTTVKVGDFFSSSWGYDQTNVTFYKVVGFTASGKSVKVQQWSQAFHSTSGGPVDYVVPGEGPATSRDWSTGEYKPAPVKTKRLATPGFGGVWLSMSSFESASLWDGEPEYQTGGGWGH